MSPSPLAIPPLLLVTTLAVRLSARFLSQTSIRWNHCFGFGILLVMTSWALSAATPLLPGLSFAAALSCATLPFVAIGTWYFSTRALTADGKAGGWLNGLNITLGTMLFAAAVVLPLARMINRLL